MAQASFELGTSRSRVLRSAVAPHWLGYWSKVLFFHISITEEEETYAWHHVVFQRHGDNIQADHTSDGQIEVFAGANCV